MDGAFGPYHAVEPRELGAENFPVQEEKCRQRMILSRRRHPVPGCQRSEERLDFHLAQVARVSPAVEEDEIDESNAGRISR